MEYWPIDYIQCNDYEDWIRMAHEADYHFVWNPIDRSIDFDLKKVNEFLDKFIGVEYGYELTLTFWIDSVT